MGRWKPDAVGRLSRTALQLFAARGFEHTTAAEIASAAGLTESTFYRNFTSKRDVLFAGFPFLEQQMAQLIREAPPEARPIEALQLAMSWLCAQHQADADLVRQRHAVIEASTELSEQELIRHTALAVVMAGVLSERGLPHADARLLAETVMVTVRLAVHEWLELISEDLGQLYSNKLTFLQSSLKPVSVTARKKASTT